MGTESDKKRRGKLLRGSNLSFDGKSGPKRAAADIPNQWRREFDGTEAGATGAPPFADFRQQGIEAQSLHPDPQQVRAGEFTGTLPSARDGELKLIANPSTVIRRLVTAL